MTEREMSIMRFDEAILLLPAGIRQAVRCLTSDERCEAEEIRLRIGHPVSVVFPDCEISAGGPPVARRDIDMLIESATEASSYSSAEQIRSGYITTRGGYRIGLCGSTAVQNGEIRTINSISSAALRISREIKGAADGIMDRICRENAVCSTLIISPPGGGKTTLLRDVVRQLSDGDMRAGRPPMRVSLADERSEIAAVSGGLPQLDVGCHTDVMDSCPKADAVMFLMRSMNPQVIVIDEITAPEDAAAIARASNCGVKLIATAHASGVEDLKSRPLYRSLLEERIFERIVTIRGKGNMRNLTVTDGDIL